MTNFLVAIAILILPFQVFAKITPENASDALLQEFYSKKQKSKNVFQIEKKDTDDIRAQSMTFLLGDQVYRLVFFNDGTLTLSTGQKGDVALQELFKSTTDQATPSQIIRMIQSFQKEAPSAQGYIKDKDISDTEERIKTQNTADALQWNGLIKRAMSGETMRISTGNDSGFSQSVSAAKMMSRCGGSSERAKGAMQNIAEALVMANFAKIKSENEAKTEKSRDFEKRSSYSFFDEVDQFNHASPERAYQLMQKTKATEYEIFHTSLQKSNQHTNDPYFLAANRNFMYLVRTIGKDKTLKLMDSSMKKIVLNIKKFVEYRKILPASSIIYDRRQDKYYIDPTLNQPSQARYVLSLACLYEWKNQDTDFTSGLSQLEQNKFKSEEDRGAFIQEIFKKYHRFLEIVSHPRF